MIPSDHFVRFYNEVFKFLEEKSDQDLRNYWLEISRHQKLHIFELFKKNEFYGMKEYYDRIIVEENLKAECFADDDHFEFHMYECASLRKAKDNDAGLMARYCDHCSGWIKPIIDELGFYGVFDLESREEPHCNFQVFKDKEVAEKAAAKGKLVIM